MSKDLYTIQLLTTKTSRFGLYYASDRYKFCHELVSNQEQAIHIGLPFRSNHIVVTVVLRKLVDGN